MTEEPYMNGKGTIDETHRLANEMWDKLEYVLLGGIAMATAIFLLIVVVVDDVSWPWPVIIALVAASWALTRPWEKAERALREHTARMKAETAKRGRGWAES